MNRLNYINVSPVSIRSYIGSSFECFFSLTIKAMPANINGNVDVILKITYLSKISSNLPEKYAVVNVPTDLIPKKNVTFELAWHSPSF